MLTVLFSAQQPNYAVLKKETGVKIDLKTVIIKPLVASVLCGVSAYGVYTVVSKNAGLSNTLACLAGIAVAVLVYGISVLLMKTLVKNDILMLPKGEKIAKILEKYKLIV